MFRLTIIFFLLGNFCVHEIWAGDTLSVNQNFSYALIGKQVDYYSSENGDLTIQQILSHPSSFPFQTNTTAMLRFREDDYKEDIWVRLPVHNSSDSNVTLIICANNTLLNKIEFYDTKENILLKHNMTGDALPFNSRLIAYRDYIFPVNLSPGESRTIYMRFDVDGRRLHIPLVVYSYKDFITYVSSKELKLGVFYGILFFLSVLCFYLYYLLRDRVFLFFAIYMFLQGMQQLSNSGVAFTFLWPSSPFLADHAPLLFMSLTMIAGVEFMVAFIRREKFTRWSIIPVRIFEWLCIFLFIGGFTTGTIYNAAVWLLYQLIAPFYLGTLIIAIIFFASRYKPARVLALALIISIGTMIALLYYEISHHGNFLTNDIVIICELLKCILLCMALLDRLRVFKEEKEKAQAELIVQLEQINDFKERVNAELEIKIEEKSQELIHKQTEIKRALIWGEEQERKRVAQELHDGMGSLLSTLRLNAEAIDLRQKNLNEKEQAAYINVIELIDLACTELRNISHNMMPTGIEQFGLEHSLRSIIKNINTTEGIFFTLDIFGFSGRMNKEIELALYRIVLELVNNIIKHSQAKNATIQLIKRDEQISLIVEDNGIGIHPSSQHGIGLLSIRTRVETLEGKFTIDSLAGRGSTFIIEIPL